MFAGSLILLRVLGGLAGIGLVIWAFGRFRLHLIQRREFFLRLLFGVALVIVAADPNSVNVFAGMLSMQRQQYGRLISLLVISNLLLWLLVFGLRSKDSRKSMQFDLLVRALAKERFLAGQGLNAIREIMVIIPALDEADNLNVVLPMMPDTISERRVGVLVVDDGSSDDTVSVVQQHGYAAVSNPINRGGGAALRLGYDIAMAGGAEIVVTMDADGQHLPEEIERLVVPIIRGEEDFVIGSRVLGKREKDSMVRWVGIHFFNAVINLLAGTNITDCSNGFRAFRVESLKKVLLLQDQFHTAELIIDAARKGIRIGEAPITVKKRYSGESKKGKNWSYGINFFKTIFKTWLRY